MSAEIVCRQAGPPGSVMIRPMTFTSCALHAALTRSGLFISVMWTEEEEQRLSDEFSSPGLQRVLGERGEA